MSEHRRATTLCALAKRMSFTAGHNPDHRNVSHCPQLLCRAIQAILCTWVLELPKMPLRHHHVWWFLCLFIYYASATVVKSGNACYHSVQNLPSSSFLSKNLKLKIYGTIILPVVLCGCENWSPALKEKCRLRVFDNRALRRKLGLRGPK